MSQNMRKRIHQIYGIALTAVTLIAGVCFIAACYGIYTAGLQSNAEQIYSRAIVEEVFSLIAVPVYLCLALTIGSFVLHLALPMSPAKPKIEKNRRLVLSRLQSKTNLDACEEQLRSEIHKVTLSRRIAIAAAATICTVCSAIFLTYACNGKNWAEVKYVTDSMIQSMTVFLPCLSISLASAIIAAYFCRNRLDRQIELMQQASKQAPKQPEAKVATVRKPLILNIVRCAIIAIGIGFILYGVNNNGVMAVVAKAVAICTECIGLG